jgi:hypothetical protein
MPRQSNLAQGNLGSGDAWFLFFILVWMIVDWGLLIKGKVI